jgi:hypothetical protein
MPYAFRFGAGLRILSHINAHGINKSNLNKYDFKTIKSEKTMRQK